MNLYRTLAVVWALGSTGEMALSTAAPAALPDRASSEIRRETVRQVPLFAGLKDDEVDCIRLGEVIQAPVGTILVEENAPAEFFFLNLEGEVHISRLYDKQEVLLGVNKPGMFMGEIPLLLNSPWLATVRVSKPRAPVPAQPGEFLAHAEHMPFGCPGGIPNRRQPPAQP